MSVRSMRQVSTGDRNLDQVQANASRALAPVIACPLLDGVLLESVQIAIDTGFGESSLIDHGLGRAHRGWLVTRLRELGIVWEVAVAEKNIASKKLRLSAYGAFSLTGYITVDLWIF